MQKLIFVLFISLFASQLEAQRMIIPIDGAVFYDMYAKPVFDTLPNGLVRITNEVVAHPLSQFDFNSMKGDLSMQVTIFARCDNYDRIGRVNLVFVSKGKETYTYDSVLRIELARFITPFMDKNNPLDSVNYDFDLTHVLPLLKKHQLSDTYDLWLELAVYGVPYAAQKQIKGCEGRIDTFGGRIVFQNTATGSESTKETKLIPIAFAHHVNNYEVLATDSLGKTAKTFHFSVDEQLENAVLYVISSNHGANEGGEEYIRRWHFISLDGKDVLSYKPGGKSCEPLRKVNTQANGIYTRVEIPEEEWTKWNNWCPGDVVPIRQIALPMLKPGNHAVSISVPDAEFKGQEGYFPVSFYIIGQVAL